MIWDFCIRDFCTQAPILSNSKPTHIWIYYIHPHMRVVFIISYNIKKIRQHFYSLDPSHPTHSIRKTPNFGVNSGVIIETRGEYKKIKKSLKIDKMRFPWFSQKRNLLHFFKKKSRISNILVSYLFIPHRQDMPIIQISNNFELP